MLHAYSSLPWLIFFKPYQIFRMGILGSMYIFWRLRLLFLNRDRTVYMCIVHIWHICFIIFFDKPQNEYRFYTIAINSGKVYCLKKWEDVTYCAYSMCNHIDNQWKHIQKVCSFACHKHLYVQLLLLIPLLISYGKSHIVTAHQGIIAIFSIWVGGGHVFHQKWILIQIYFKCMLLLF